MRTHELNIGHGVSMYSYGECSLCGIKTWLKDHKCAKCNLKDTDMPEFLRKLFNADTK